MKVSLSLLLLLGAFGAASSAVAEPVSYNILFTVNAGNLPDSGSFFYDPASQTFSSFHVQWNGLDFDLTTAANAPSLVGRCNSGVNPPAADFFAYMNGNACVLRRTWSATAVADDNGFIGIGGGNRDGWFVSSSIAVGASGPAGSAAGFFSIEPAASGPSSVPEPSSWVLMLGGSGALAVWNRRKKKR